MPKPTQILLTVLTFSILACATFTAEQAVAQSEAGSTDEVRRALAAIDLQWEEAANRGDAAGVAALYTEDAYLLAPNLELAQGRESIRRTIQAFVDAGLRNVDFTTVHVETSGDLAYEVGRYTLDLGTQGQRVTDTGKYVIVAKRQPGGGWKLVADMFNTSQPATPPGEPAR